MNATEMIVLSVFWQTNGLGTLGVQKPTWEPYISLEFVDNLINYFGSFVLCDGTRKSIALRCCYFSSWALVQCPWM